MGMAQQQPGLTTSASHSPLCATPGLRTAPHTRGCPWQTAHVMVHCARPQLMPLPLATLLASRALMRMFAARSLPTPSCGRPRRHSLTTHRCALARNHKHDYTSYTTEVCCWTPPSSQYGHRQPIHTAFVRDPLERLSAEVQSTAQHSTDVLCAYRQRHSSPDVLVVV